eukprot:SAG22_NODE_4598_length_1221_cov_1.030303_1_plen_42_part_10
MYTIEAGSRNEGAAARLRPLSTKAAQPPPPHLAKMTESVQVF